MAAARDVQAALNAAATDLPTGLPNVPVFRKANPNNAAPVLILALTSDSAVAVERRLRCRRHGAAAAHLADVRASPTFQRRPAPISRRCASPPTGRQRLSAMELSTWTTCARRSSMPTRISPIGLDRRPDLRPRDRHRTTSSPTLDDYKQSRRQETPVGSQRHPVGCRRPSKNAHAQRALGGDLQRQAGSVLIQVRKQSDCQRHRDGRPGEAR